MSALPNELWLQVFDSFDDFGDALNESRLDEFSSDLYGIKVHKRHREVTASLLAASLVCSRFSNLVRNALLCYIVITNGRQLKPLRRALRVDAQSVRRIDVALAGYHIWKEEDIQAFAKMLSKCTSLRVFSSGFSDAETVWLTEGAIFKALTRLCAQNSLRRLEAAVYSAGRLEEILTQMPRLTSLWVTHVILRGCRQRLEIKAFANCKLEKLAISRLAYTQTRYCWRHLPSLRHLILIGQSLPLPMEQPVQLRNFEFQESWVKSLSVEYPGDPARLAKEFPNVQELTLQSNASMTAAFLIALDLHHRSPIKRLGRAAEAFFPTLTSLAVLVPSQNSGTSRIMILDR